MQRVKVNQKNMQINLNNNLIERWQDKPCTKPKKDAKTLLKALVARLRAIPSAPQYAPMADIFCSEECHAQEREKILNEIERFLNSL